MTCKHSRNNIRITISQVVGPTQLLPCVTKIQTDSNTVTKHVCLTVVQNDTYYSREGTPVSAPIRGNAMQPSGDMVKENNNSNITKTKTNPFTSRKCPDICLALTGEKQLEKEFLAPAPGRSTDGVLNPRPKDQTGIETRVLKT